MRGYTDIKQSKKLAEILPIKSADMVLLHEEPYETSDSKFDGLHQALCVPYNQYDKSWRQKYRNISYFPCWSLAALSYIIRKTIGYVIYGINNVYISCELADFKKIETDVYDNEIDACYEMILRLHELKLL